MSARRSLFVFLVLLVASPLGAQPPTDVAAIGARAAAEQRCIDGAQGDLARWSRLLADARRQLESGASPTVRTDAAQAIVVLEDHVRETAAALTACMPPAEAPEPAADPEPSADALTPISLYLLAGEPRTSGRGQLEASAVRRALDGFGRSVDLCYESLAERLAIVRGSAELAMQVRSDGGMGRVELRGLALGDATFQRCVHQALPRIASPGRPRGGEASLVLPLRFGPDT